MHSGLKLKDYRVAKIHVQRFQRGKPYISFQGVFALRIMRYCKGLKGCQVELVIAGTSEETMHNAHMSVMRKGQGFASALVHLILRSFRCLAQVVVRSTGISHAEDAQHHIR